VSSVVSLLETALEGEPVRVHQLEPREAVQPRDDPLDPLDGLDDLVGW
jgi:hypothetical protein